MDAFLHGNGGGTILNFKVVGGTSAPSNPKENTIWINTSTSVTGWVFSSTQPTGTKGKVWIKTAASSASEFNALKKNVIQVYPVTYYQYSGSAWVSVDGTIWRNGAWEVTTLTVVPNSASYGNTVWKTYHTSNSGAPSVSVSSTTLTVALNAYKNEGISAAYIPVDVTGYSKMTIAGSYTIPNNAYGANLSISVGMFASFSGSITTGYYDSGAKDDSTTTISEKSYDISGLTGTYYFVVRAKNNASSSDLAKNPTVKLTKVFFE